MNILYQELAKKSKYISLFNAISHEKANISKRLTKAKGETENRCEPVLRADDLPALFQAARAEKSLEKSEKKVKKTQKFCLQNEALVLKYFLV